MMPRRGVLLVIMLLLVSQVGDAFYLPLAPPPEGEAGSDFGHFGAWTAARRSYTADSGVARLRLWDGRDVRWDTGPVAALLETSLAVRFSLRGIHFYARDDGNEHIRPLAEGWACPRTKDALCVFFNDGSHEVAGRAFPSDAAPRFGPVGDLLLLLPVAAEGRHHHHPAWPLGRLDGCGLDGGGGRVAVALPGYYDLSPCDLLSVDLLWTDGRLYSDAGVRLPLWAYAATGLAVLFLVISLGQNLGSILGDPEASTHPLFTEILCLLQCLGLVALNDPCRVWVSSHDQAMLAATLLYVALYLGRHAFDLCMAEHVHTLNVITATLALVTARLYCSFETPYATVFLVLLQSRLAHKLFFAARLSGLERLTVSADAAYLALHYRLAYRPGFFDPQAAPVYLCALTAACVAVGALTHAIEVRAEARRQPQGVGGGPGAAAPLGHQCDPVAFRADRRDPGHYLRLQFLDR